MKRFIFSLPDELSDRIEAYRRENGLKASAEAVRVLIELGLGLKPEPVAAPSQPRPRPPLSFGRSKTVVAPATRQRVDVLPRPSLDLPVGNIKGPIQKGRGKGR